MLTGAHPLLGVEPVTSKGNTMEHRVLATPQGRSFARVAIALIVAKGDGYAAREVAAHRWPGDLAAHEFLVKSGVGAGSTTDATFASALAQPGYASSEFMALLRNGTIAGKLTGMRRPPLNIRFAKETSSSSVAWLGETASTPMSKLQLATMLLGYAKIAGIVAITRELAFLSDPAAEGLIQTDLLAAATQFLDQQFVDPGVAAVVNVSPASITNAPTHTDSTGSTASLIAADLTTMATALADNNETDSMFWIMSRSDAVRLSTKTDTAGGRAFEDMRADGGTLLGIPAIVSNSVPHSTSAGSVVILVNASGIAYAGSNLIELSVSTEAALQFSDSPTSPGAASLLSLFQKNMAAVRLVAFANWMRIRDTAVVYLDNCRW